MPALTIKNMSTEMYYELKTVAEHHHRSINSEILICLEEKLFPKRLSAEERLVEIQALRAHIKSTMITTHVIDQAISEGRL